MSKRRKFSPEFKQGAVEQTRQLGVSCAQVARELGIGANLLTRWKREADAEGRHAAAFGHTIRGVQTATSRPIVMFENMSVHDRQSRHPTGPAATTLSRRPRSFLLYDGQRNTALLRRRHPVGWDAACLPRPQHVLRVRPVNGAPPTFSQLVQDRFRSAEPVPARDEKSAVQALRGGRRRPTG